MGLNIPVEIYARISSSVKDDLAYGDESIPQHLWYNEEVEYKPTGVKATLLQVDMSEERNNLAFLVKENGEFLVLSDIKMMRMID